jgi:cysteine-rich repeat protein
VKSAPFTLATLLLAAPFLGLACYADSPPGGGAGGGGSTSITTTTTTGTEANRCGDGVVGEGEECDGADLAGNTCASVGEGYTGGALGCTLDCVFDLAGCSRTELRCWDGADDDQNGLTDCLDPACKAACAASCDASALVALHEPNTITGSTFLHAATSTSACGSSPAGPSLVFSVTPQHTGVLSLALTSAADLTLAVRTTCGDAASEVGCAHRVLSPGLAQRLTVPCTSGEPLLVVVQGYGASSSGPFDLTAASRPITCGDGFTDGAETCDDGNTQGGDGCSATCQLEPTEAEPNDTAAQANAFQSPWFGRISSASDVDVVAVPVTTVPAGLRAAVRDFDGHACEEGGLEALLEIIGPDGVTVITSRDTGGAQACPADTAPITTAGTYYVRVRAAGAAFTPVFSYRLDVEVEPAVCGDGALQPTEQCDDGNTKSGDGCSASCQLEPSEVEPNDALAQANTYRAPWVGQIAPAGDVDVIAFDVPAGAGTVAVQVGDNGDGDCANDQIVSRVELLAPDGVTVLGSNQGATSSYCAFLVVHDDATSTPIKAGKHYVRVRAGQSAPSSTFTYTLAIDVQ